MSDVLPRPQTDKPPRWRPIPAIDRRLLGVLVEKAKTTPDIYPMSIAALKSGANQKNNRFPTMQLEEEQIEEALTRLRDVGAVGIVQGSGRVDKFRHYAYEWLGVDKAELAVMTELLLRGAQTEGELRGRAARMEPIPDLPALRPVLDSLKQKGLIIPLTPEGRGHVLTHALYLPKELDRMRADQASAAAMSPALGRDADDNASPPQSVPRTNPSTTFASSPAPRPTATDEQASAALRAELSAERDRVTQLASDVEQLGQRVDQLTSELERLRAALGDA